MVQETGSGDSVFGIRGLAGVTVALALLTMSTASAQEDPTFSFSVGAFFTDRDSRTRLNGTVGEGTDVDLENDLGLKRSDTVVRLDGYWRFADKHRVDFSVFDMSRSATKNIEKEISWQDTVFLIDTQLKASIDLSIYKASYTWMFLKRDRSFLGATVGLYVADVGTRLSATAQNISESGGVTAPLPVAGLRGEYKLSDRWSVRGSAEIFVVEYDEYSGSLSDVFVGLDFSATERMAVGVGFNAVNLDVGVSKANFEGNFDWQYDGAMAYLKFDF
jgi:hypothetical protein